MIALAKLPHLHSLSLSYLNKVGSSHGTRYQWLYHGVTDTGVIALAELPHLHSLSLSNLNKVGSTQGTRYQWMSSWSDGYWGDSTG